MPFSRGLSRRKEVYLLHAFFSERYRALRGLHGPGEFEPRPAARRMLMRGLPPEQIADYTDLSLEQIEALRHP